MRGRGMRRETCERKGRVKKRDMKEWNAVDRMGNEEGGGVVERKEVEKMNEEGYEKERCGVVGMAGEMKMSTGNQKKESFNQTRDVQT